MKAKQITLTGHNLTLVEILQISRAKQGEVEFIIPQEARRKMQDSYNYVHEIVQSRDQVVYGINTGFGALSNKKIDNNQLTQLQENLVRSHCTGVGKAFTREVTRAIILIRANCLISGHSGVNVDTVTLLLSLLSHDILPIIPSQGSVGASGDLAPLAHLALTLIGEGEVTFQEQVMSASQALKTCQLTPRKLGPKEGLALINGTAVMCALGSLALAKANDLAVCADLISSLTLDALRGSISPFHQKISELKPHPGQLKVSQNLATILQGSQILTSHESCDRVQDPYSLRCIPQVHGAARQCLRHASEVIMTELSSVTDNPLIFCEEDLIVSGGNFHGQAIAMAMDYLCMGINEFGSISERRIEKMMNPEFSRLPAFLVEGSGLNSGYMIAQVTAAALASENKGLCHPASVDTIPTSTDKEDHVSMGVRSGIKLHEVLNNTQYIIAIELMCACSALEFSRPLKSSPSLEKVYELVRRHVTPLENKDRVLAPDIERVASIIESGELTNILAKNGYEFL